jgi:hypothetical protein
MKALLNPGVVSDLPDFRGSVRQAETTRRIMHEHYTELEGDDHLIKTTQENVRS